MNYEHAALGNFFYIDDILFINALFFSPLKKSYRAILMKFTGALFSVRAIDYCSEYQNGRIKGYDSTCNSRVYNRWMYINYSCV